MRVDVSFSAMLVGAMGSSCFRNSGPVSHLDFNKSATEIGLVPISAGLYLVAILDHW